MPLTARQQAGFDHLVVLMGENRSFDNLLGYLYSSDDLPDGETLRGARLRRLRQHLARRHRRRGPRLRGLDRRDHGPPEPRPGRGVPARQHADLRHRRPRHERRALRRVHDGPVQRAAPQRRRDDVGLRPRLLDQLHAAPQGHAALRRRGARRSWGRSPRRCCPCSPRSRRTSPSTTTGTARCRRRRSATGRSSTPRRRTDSSRTRHGGGYDKWLDAPAAPTIFNRLEEAGISWRIYFDELQLVSFTGVLHAPVLEQYWRTERFATMSDFYEDVKLGTLPAYSFIEPRMTYNHNDFHPPFGRLRESDVSGVEVIDSRRLRRACGRGARARDLRGDQAQRAPRRAPTP